MRATLSIEKIKSELIKSCLNYDTKSFIPFLLSKKVFTGMPNKMRFYNFYKKMVNSTKQNSKGELIFKVNTISKKENEWNYYLEFYDAFHTNSRLTFEVNENNNRIFIDTLPF
jgi:hypothetical protein